MGRKGGSGAAPEALDARVEVAGGEDVAPGLVLVPVDKVAEAEVDGGGGLVAEEVLGPLDVGEGGLDLADGLLVLELGVGAHLLLDGGDELGEFDGLVVAEVEDGGGVGAELHGGDDAGDDVVDVGKISLHFPLIVDGERLALLDGSGEEEGGHVGPAPGAVDGEEAEADGVEVVDVVVGGGDLLVGELGGAVEVGGVGHLVGLCEGNFRVEAVNARRRGVDEGRPRSTRHLPDLLDQGDEALQVVPDVGERVRERVPHAGLRGEVDDVRELVLVEELLEQRGVADVPLEDLQAVGLAQVLGSSPLVGGRVVPVEVVEAEHELRHGGRRRSRSGEPGHERHPDEPRAPRHQDARRAPQLVPLRLVRGARHPGRALLGLA
mmetsp:Transcript_2169/g.6638  ORF Transcript_2169/g.6638 Transcript_2169/m.6638 type:complete len:379 (-) Transcript_2169:203-1339(-)